MSEDFDLDEEEGVDTDLEDMEDEADDSPLDNPDPPKKRGRPKGAKPKAAKPKAEKPAKAAKPKTEKPAKEEKPHGNKGKLGAPVGKALLNQAERKACEDDALLFEHASSPTRLAVIRTLAKHGEVHVGALCNTVGSTQPAVSHHLALLRHAGVIEPRREGKNNFYSLTDKGERLIQLCSAG